MTSHGQGDKRDVMMQEVKWPIYVRGSNFNYSVNLNLSNIQIMVVSCPLLEWSVIQTTI